MHIRKYLLTLAVVGLTATVAAVSGLDFGLFRDGQLSAHSNQLFGIIEGLDASSTDSVDAFTANSDPRTLVTLAKGLHARVISARPNTGANIDMMALWPNDSSPTHLIACNEQGTADPGLQRIRISDGFVETILTGTSSCDPVRRTAWGTIVFGEEVGGTGWLIELINPLQTTGVTFDRNSGTFGGANAANLAVRPAVGRLAFEGLGLFPNGVMYYGDEKRPGTGTPGGAYFKFIPTTPYTGFSPISNLSQSPLIAGKVYGLRLGRRSGNTDYGQGANTGQGIWVEVVNANNLNLTTTSATLKLTGYYRPEDLEVDLGALAEGNVRVCGNNTGNESNDRNWGETVCITDGTMQEATANMAIPEVQYLVIGSPGLAMMDNMAYQPRYGNWILHEDGDGPEVGRNNDLWSCLDDGDDEDQLSDGCVRIGTLNDLNAEWTGGQFDRWGDHFYVSIQHNVTGHGVVLDITGWK